MKKLVRVLDEFEINEVSTVDAAAQEGAEIDLLKRQRLAERGNAMPDGSFPIASAGDLKNAIRAYGRAKPEDRAAVAAHIKRRAKELGQEDLLPESGDLAKDMPTGSTGGGHCTEQSMDEKNKTAATPEQVAELAKAKAELMLAKAHAALSDAEKAHRDALPENQRDEFALKPEAERANLVKAAREADSIVYTSDSGETFRKSDDPRLVRLAKQSDENARLAKAEREARESDQLAKRAGEQLSHLPGTVAHKVALLKAIGGVSDSASRTAIEQLLAAADEAMAKNFKKNGVGGEKTADSDAKTKLDVLVKARAQQDRVDEYEALDRVMTTREGQLLAVSIREGN